MTNEQQAEIWTSRRLNRARGKGTFSEETYEQVALRLLNARESEKAALEARLAEASKAMSLLAGEIANLRDSNRNLKTRLAEAEAKAALADVVLRSKQWLLPLLVMTPSLFPDEISHEEVSELGKAIDALSTPPEPAPAPANLAGEGEIP